MQAIGGNRGAAAYSSDSLDDAINFIGQYNATAKSVLPQLSQKNVSDSGVYTTYFGVNLRDQIRPNDPIPLQFQYEPANCRIFYSLVNVYNMSRLWRDVIAASFDDNALCVEGSYHSTNVTVAPPAPRTLNLSPEHHGGLDGHEYTFDTPGDGLQDVDEQARSGVITTCGDNRECEPRSQCITVTDLPCTTSDNRDLMAKLCLTQITGTIAQWCSAGTVFKRISWLPWKGVYGVVNPDFPIYGSYTGFCWPAQGNTLWGCPKQQKGLGL